MHVQLNNPEIFSQKRPEIFGDHQFNAYRSNVGYMVETLSDQLTNAYFAGEWTLRLARPAEIGLMSSVMQFQAERSDALFDFVEPPVLVGDKWYAIINWHLKHVDECPREFLVRFDAAGTLNSQGFEVLGAYTTDDINVVHDGETVPIAKADHWYNPLYNPDGSSTILDTWNKLVTTQDIDKLNALPWASSNNNYILSLYDLIDPEYSQSGTLVHLYH